MVIKPLTFLDGGKSWVVPTDDHRTSDPCYGVETHACFKVLYSRQLSASKIKTSNIDENHKYFRN